MVFYDGISADLQPFARLERLRIELEEPLNGARTEEEWRKVVERHLPHLRSDYIDVAITKNPCKSSPFVLSQSRNPEWFCIHPDIASLMWRDERLDDALVSLWEEGS